MCCFQRHPILLQQQSLPFHLYPRRLSVQMPLEHCQDEQQDCRKAVYFKTFRKESRGEERTKISACSDSCLYNNMFSPQWKHAIIQINCIVCVTYLRMFVIERISHTADNWWLCSMGLWMGQSTCHHHYKWIGNFSIKNASVKAIIGRSVPYYCTVDSDEVLDSLYS